MEITSNKINSVALRGDLPAKASSIETSAKVADVKVMTVAAEKVASSEQVNTSEPTESLQVAIAKINEHMQIVERSLQFTIDEDSGKDVVTVSDRKTKEIIRQFPSEEVLVIARQIAENNDKAISLVNVVA